MPSSFSLLSPSIFPTTAISISSAAAQFIQLQFKTTQNHLNRSFTVVTAVSGKHNLHTDQPSVILDSLRVLQWDQLCDCVASFAGTSIGKKFVKEQLWNLDKTYEDSLILLEETNAALEMRKYGIMMDFTGVDVSLVQTAIQCAQRGSPVSGIEAMALVALLQYAEALQLNVKAAIKEDSDWYRRFMPLSAMIIELVINPSLVRFIQQLIDEDGSVRDSASSNLRHARDHVRFLERKLFQLMESMIRNEMKESPTLEVSNIDGRWCIKTGADMRPTFEGLLLSSGSRAESLVEPLSAVPLNDELQQARLSVAKAEADVLLKIATKMQMDLNDIQHLCNSMIQIDMINARARYSISFDGSWPDLYNPQEKHSSLNAETSGASKISTSSQLNQRKWTLYLPKACHPLLLLRHRQNLKKAMKDLSDANAGIEEQRERGSTLTN